MYFESIFVLVQAIDEWKRVFLKDLFTVDTLEPLFFFSQIQEQWFMHCVLEHL